MYYFVNTGLYSRQDNKGKVYELVVRHFLACVSEDARGQETQVEVTVDEEHFSLNGLQVLQRNYLEVYPYEKWSSKEIPVYNEQERFLPSGLFVSMENNNFSSNTHNSEYQ